MRLRGHLRTGGRRYHDQVTGHVMMRFGDRTWAVLCAAVETIRNWGRNPDLTSADNASLHVVAGSPGRRVAGSPGRRVALPASA